MIRSRFIFIVVSLLAIVILASSFTDFGDVLPAISDPTAVSTTTTTAEETTTTAAEETTTTTTESTVETTMDTTTTTNRPTTAKITTVPAKRIVAPAPLEYATRVTGQSVSFKEIHNIGLQIAPQSAAEAGIVHSFEELQSGIGATEGNLSSLLERYDAAYFNENALVIVCYNQKIPVDSLYWDPIYDYVTDVSIENNTLSMMTLVGGTKLSEDMKEWPETVYQNCLVLEVKKEEIKNVQKMKVLIAVMELC